MDHLQACTRDTGGGTRSLPAREDLPILVASRMSMSVPGLFRPVPVELADVETARRVRRLSGQPPSSDEIRPAWRRVLFSDGGSTSNFPIHLFDAPLPDWPTYAIDFEDLPPGAEGVGRVVILDEAGEPRIRPIGSAAAYFGALLATSQNWNDLLLSLLPIHRDRIARVHLAASQGGLNLTMTEAEVVTMMGYGREAGALLAATSFPAHQARRTEALYANLVEVARQARKVWARRALRDDFREGKLPAPDLTPSDRRRIADALDRFADIARLPRRRGLQDPSAKGRTRITPRF
jgi:predicted acylesterase/phospholipase RssA